MKSSSAGEVVVDRVERDLTVDEIDWQLAPAPRSCGGDVLQIAIRAEDAAAEDPTLAGEIIEHLIAALADARAEQRATRAVLVEAIHRLHGQHLDLQRARESVARLRDELRRRRCR